MLFVHGLLVMVQRNVYEFPATPVNVDIELAVLPKDPPVPLTIVHPPVPTEGELAASVTEVIPQVALPF